MTRFPVGRCRSCDAPVSYFSLSCPRCHALNQPNLVTSLAALAVVVLVGGSIALGIQSFRSAAAPPGPSAGDGAVSKGEPSADGADDYGWIVKAMAECDVAAKHQLDTMHFLIVPVTSTGMSLPGWSPRPIGKVGSSAALLTSVDAMIGLRNRMLMLYQKPLTFAVSDPATNTVQKWKPAVGVTSLTTRDTGLTSLTLGFEIPDLAKDVEWGPTINLSQGTCYWINPIISVGTRSG